MSTLLHINYEIVDELDLSACGYKVGVKNIQQREKSVLSNEKNESV